MKNRFAMMRCSDRKFKRRKIEWIEWKHLIVLLLLALYLSAMSKLLSASPKPISTPSGLTFNPLENSKKSLKMMPPPSYTKNSVRPHFRRQNFAHKVFMPIYLRVFSCRRPFSIYEDDAPKG